MNRSAIDELKQRIPLLEYVQANGWKVARSIRGGRFLGLCPLHDDHNQSFLVDPCRNLFYCYSLLACADPPKLPCATLTPPEGCYQRTWPRVVAI